MREFNKVSAKYWMTSLTKHLKQLGPEALLLSIYLQTNHHTHSLGIFYLPINYIAQDTGIKPNKINDLLITLIKFGFCRYDFNHHYIWLLNYALEQTGGPLKESDNRVVQARKYYAELPLLDFIDEFLLRHREDFHLSVLPKESHKNQCNSIKNDGAAKGDYNIFEAPSYDLASTETKTETGTKTDHNVACLRPYDVNNPIHNVFEHWKQVMNHPQARLDNKRKSIIKIALDSGYTVEQLKQAVDGCAHTPHNMGDNERGQRYDGLHVILRNADQIDRFIRNHKSPPQLHSKNNQRAKRAYASLQDWIQGEQESTHGVK